MNQPPPTETTTPLAGAEDIVLTIRLKSSSSPTTRAGITRLQANAALRNTTPPRLLAHILAQRLGPDFEVKPATAA